MCADGDRECELCVLPTSLTYQRAFKWAVHVYSGHCISLPWDKGTGLALCNRQATVYRLFAHYLIKRIFRLLYRVVCFNECTFLMILGVLWTDQWTGSTGSGSPRLGPQNGQTICHFPSPGALPKGCYFHQPGIVCVPDTPKEKDLGELSLYRVGSEKSCEAESYN